MGEGLVERYPYSSAAGDKDKLGAKELGDLPLGRLSEVPPGGCRPSVGGVAPKRSISGTRGFCRVLGSNRRPRASFAETERTRFGPFRSPA